MVGLSVVPVRLGFVITGELKSKIDRVWDAFWSGGISNPLEVIEQITYLLFIRRLDENHTAAENKARRTKTPLVDPVFTEAEKELRWSEFRQLEPEEMFDVVSKDVFPHLQRLGGAGSTYAEHMKDARFTIPTKQLLAKVVDMLADVPLHNRDTNGDLYEYMLSKLASAGQNGQFRTPRHIIQLMVEMTAPAPTDTICDPACGTSGFLVAASEFVRGNHSDMLRDAKGRKHFTESMFHGYDFDSTMLRIGSMNMMMHGVERPDIRYRDSLAQVNAGDEDAFSLILANPPFAGSLDYDATSSTLLADVKTKKTELLFVALFIRLLQPGGRAAVIVPDGVLFGSTKAHKGLRKMLVEEQKLDAVVKLPSGVFKPYAGVSTAILFFTKTNSGGTEDVWFYDMQADGWSLDDKRSPLLDETKLGPTPIEALREQDHEHNNLPDLLARWQKKGEPSETERARTEQSFTVPKAEIAEADYDLSFNRYKEIVYDDVDHDPPLDIIAELEQLETEITTGLTELKGLLK